MCGLFPSRASLLPQTCLADGCSSSRKAEADLQPPLDTQMSAGLSGCARAFECTEPAEHRTLQARAGVGRERPQCLDLPGGISVPAFRWPAAAINRVQGSGWWLP